MRSHIVPLIAILFCSCTMAQEMLQNPGFEAGPGEGVPTGWTRYGGDEPESQLQISAEAHSGARAIRLIDTGPNERDNRWAVGVSQTLDVEPGTMYRAEAWVKCFARNDPTAVNLQLTFRPSNKVFVTRLTPPIGGDWQKFTVIGEAQPGDTQVIVYAYTMHFWTCDCLVDDLSLMPVSREAFGDRLPLVALGGLGIDEVRPLRLQTPLVLEGKPAATICAPQQAEWQEVATALRAAVTHKTGVELPVVDEGEGLLDTEQTIIALGNLNNNFVTERLHWNKYLIADALTPGAGKYVLRTVHQPFNFKPTVNVLTVEASDAAGCAAGVEALVALLPEAVEGNLVLAEPLLLNPAYAPLDQAATQALLDQPLSRDPWRDFWSNANLYRDRGDIAYAKKAGQLLFAILQQYQDDPSRAVTWPEETTSNSIGPAWDVLEECPIFSDEERLQATNTLLMVNYELTRHVSGWGKQADNDTITWNHTTFPILGIFWISRYFERWYGNVDSRIAMMMAEVEGCFRGQLKSWKPQCDADGYLTIVPRHLMEYTLAQGDYSWFESGKCRQFAEYLTALSDNRGVQPGLGDSGYSTTPGYELSGLPMALWYYRDGRYLWRLQQVMQGNWKNPYDQSITPRKWYSMAGLVITPLDPENYNYSKTRSYYGEPITPPNVPYEKSFDKITFRENVEPDGEFLLLDGYSSGKHLHYDGNSIIKFSADGEDWLVDADYLVRNTTEHSMVSIIRDGRANQTIPVCTGLEHVGDFRRSAVTQTRVGDWNQTDWTRHIAWLKGEFFLVLDECRANAPGEYTFESVFKTLDRGRQELAEERVFSTRVASWGGVGSRELVTVKSPEPGVEAAVEFAEPRSQLDFPLEAPAGEYEITLFARGLDGGSDSFFVSVDDGDPVAFHIGSQRFGPSSSNWAQDAPTPNVTVPTDGLHRVSVTLREGPGCMLDRVLIRNAAGETVLQFEAEQAPQLPAEMLQMPPDKRFFIKSDGTCRSSMSTRTSNVGLAVRKLHQRFGGQMEAEDRASSMSILYNDDAAEAKGYDIRRLGTRSALILKDDEPFGLYSADVSELGLQPSLSTDAAALFIAGQNLYLVDATSLGLDGPRMDAPVCVELDLDSGYGMVHAGQNTHVSLPGGVEFEVFRGAMDFDVTMLDGAIDTAALKALPGLLAAKAVAPPAGSGTQSADRGLRPLWRTAAVSGDGPPATIGGLLPIDIDADGSQEVIALRGPQAVCLDRSGRELWVFSAADTLNAIAAADLHGDGALEVLVGGDDEHFYILDAGTGAEQARCRVETLLRVGTSSVRRPAVAAICVGDVDLDGVKDILIGTKNGNIARYDLDLKLVWSFDQIEHGTRDMVLVDLAEDEKLEIVAENKYGAVEVLNAAGHAMTGTHSELGDVEMAIGDIDGDGKLDIANGSSTGAFTCRTYGGAELFRFDNAGYGVLDVRIGALEPDGPPLVLLASETGYVYALNAAGEVVARRNLGEAVLELELLQTAGGTEVLAGCRDGRLYGLSARLEPVREFTCGWPVERLAVAEARGEPLLIAGGGTEVVALGVQ